MLFVSTCCNAEPIQLVVPYAPGGSADTMGRVINEILLENHLNSIVVNKPGAGTIIGANYVARAKPDGKTIFISAAGTLDSNLVFKAEGVEYSVKSFTPIIPLGTTSYVLVVPASSPINNYEEFKEYVKANPDKFNLGFWNASTANIFTDWTKKAKLPNPRIILYKSSNAQITDVIGNNIPFIFDTWVAVYPHLQDGKIKVIATLDKSNLEAAKKFNPLAVSLAQLYPGLDFGLWYGLWAPAGTSPEFVAQLNSMINSALKDSRYGSRLVDLGFKDVGGTPKDLQSLQEKNYRILEKVANDIK